MKAIKEINDSTPGEDRVRLGHRQNTCDEVQHRMIKVVKMMFDKRANAWAESAKSDITIMIK